MWLIAFDFLKRFWKPLLFSISILIFILGLKVIKSRYDEALRDEGRGEIQIIFDKYRSDQEANAKKANDELLEKVKQLREAEAEAQAKAEQIKQLTAKELDYEIKTKIVYRNCKLPQSGVQLYKSAASRR